MLAGDGVLAGHGDQRDALVLCPLPASSPTRAHVELERGAVGARSWTIDASKVEIISPPTYWHCEPEWSWHARPLPDYLLWYVLDGRGVVTIGHETVDLPGTCLVFKPGDEPVADQDRRRRLRIFGLHFEVTGDGPSDVVPLVTWCRLRDRELAAALARRCDTSYRRGDGLGQQHSRLCVEQILCMMWEDWTHPELARPDARIAKLAEAIRHDPSRPWSAGRLAEAASLSRAQFTRRFTRYAGVAPIRYVIQARVDRASQLTPPAVGPEVDKPPTRTTRCTRLPQGPTAGGSRTVNLAPPSCA